MKHEWGGPVQGRWCYPIERCLKVLRKKCGNKCKIEGSIAEAYILEEVSNFTTTYYGDNLPSVHNPPTRYNVGVNESSLSLFQGQLGTASGSTTKMLSNQEWRQIMLYVLINLDEVAPYMTDFVDEFRRGSVDPTDEEFHTLLRQGAGNGKPDFISWLKQKVQSNLGSTHIFYSKSLLYLLCPIMIELVGPKRCEDECRVERGETTLSTRSSPILVMT